MKISLVCENCKKKLTVELKTGVKPTASLYKSLADSFSFTEKGSGYICKECKDKEEKST